MQPLDPALAAQPLTHLRPHRPARIVEIRDEEPMIAEMLGDLGFTPGREVEIMARGLLGGTPLAVRLDNTIIALRRREAALVAVEPTP